MPQGQNEAFSRILIDRALEFSGWDLLDPQQVQFELHTSNGRADYLLKDKLGRLLCVLEAKREDLDPYDAKEQARGYAKNLRFFADGAAKKWPLRGSLKGTAAFL
jgi:predicted type IV restriction endonuclease